MKGVKLIMFCSLLVSGAACNFTRSQPAKAENEGQRAAEVAAAETTPAATPSATPAEETADALIRDVYKVHGEDMKTPSRDRIMGGKSRTLLDKYFEKKLADLIWKDMTTHPGEIGVIDWDIFYATQDPQIKNVVVAPAAVNGDKATVRVTFTNYTSKEIVTYLMAKEGGKWKIHDIKYTTGGTLLEAFAEDAKTQKQQEKEER